MSALFIVSYVCLHVQLHVLLFNILTIINAKYLQHLLYIFRKNLYHTVTQIINEIIPTHNSVDISVKTTKIKLFDT